MNNFDRIKSMDVEGMAVLFAYLADAGAEMGNSCCSCIMYAKNGMSENCHNVTCKESIRRWLLQEVSEK